MIAPDNNLGFKLSLKSWKLNLKSTCIDVLSTDTVIQCVIDFESNNFLYVNSDWESSTGFDPKEVVGKPWLDYVYFEDSDLAGAYMHDIKISIFGQLIGMPLRIRTNQDNHINVFWGFRLEDDTIIAVGKVLS